MVRAACLTVVLAVLWLLLSGHFHETLILGLGVLSILFTVYIARRMNVVDEEGVPLELFPRVIAYWGWLMVEIVKSSIHILRVLVQPSMPLSITVEIVETTQKTDLGRVVHANSITLTPGTVTIEIDENKFLVHAITDSSAAGLHSGDMDRRVTAVEGR